MRNILYSFDIGTNSIGWCVFELDADDEPCRIRDIGTRIYADGRDPQSKTSLAVARREARAMARRRDRYVRRRRSMLRTLSEFGLMPEERTARQNLVRDLGDRPRNGDGENDTPYDLRRRALDEKLSLYQIGRAIFHLNQRRGFKSNRKTDRKDNDLGKIASGVRDLHAELRKTHARTYGEYLAMRREAGMVARLRAGSDVLTAEGYIFYPDRALLEAEFNAIWHEQMRHYPEILTEERRAHLFRIIFYQRPLKKPRIGRCALNPVEERMAKAHPLFQEFRLYKEVNELGLILPDQSTRKLTLDQRDTLISLLRSAREIAFAKLRKDLKLSPDVRFNKESDSRLKIRGDEVYAALSDKKRFGNLWSRFSRDEQWAIIDKLRTEENPDVLYRWIEQQFGISGEQAEAIANCPLPEGYGRYGPSALSNLLDALKGEVISEAAAAEACGYDHAQLAYEGEGEPFLPPYQEILERHIPPGSGNPEDMSEDGRELVLTRFRDGKDLAPPVGYDLYRGRITNPTVHIGLNQLRRLVNRLIRRHGKPRMISVELARDLPLSDVQRAEKNREIARNTRDAERRSRILEEHKQPDTGHNRMLLKLWEELNPSKPEDRVCIYSGKPIGISMLFSAEVEIDHILPWSRTLDDSQANRILCLRSANREKRNRAPAEVTEWQGDYDGIVARAARLPKNKRWRFAADAMQRFKEEGGFLARQLVDTQYLARMAAEYLGCLFPSEEVNRYGEFSKRNHVVVSPGRLTEMLRRNWGLNNLLPDHEQGGTSKEKNRKDHRHHAIDAAVIGVTTRRLLQRIATASGQMEDADLDNLIKRMVSENPPWPTFREDLQKAVNGFIVSHKPDHGTVSREEYATGRGQTAGRLHNDTAYGFGTDKNGNPVAVRRKAFLSLEPKDVGAIRDEGLQKELFEILNGLTDKKDIQAALLTFRQSHPKFRGIRRVRIQETVSLIPIRNAEGKAYKGYKGDANHHYDVWETLDGKWHSEVVSMFDAHQPGWQSAFHKANPAARRVLRLQQNDMVAYDHPKDGFTIARVVKFVGDGRIYFAPHRESGSLKARDANKNDPFCYFVRSSNGLRDVKCRQIRIDEAGRVFDPGPLDQGNRPRRRRVPKS